MKMVIILFQLIMLLNRMFLKSGLEDGEMKKTVYDAKRATLLSSGQGIDITRD